MKIEKVKVGKISIPLKTPFKTALREVYTAEEIIVKIITDNGAIGFGNAPATVVITGDSLDSITTTIKNVIAPKIIGLNIENREMICQNINNAMVHNTSAKAAVDIAIHDLFGQCYGMPLQNFFGGKLTSIKSDLTISINEPEIMLEDACKALEAGYTDLKLKVGIDVKTDIERVQAVRKAVGPDINIRLDANQGWSPKAAVRTIRKFEDMGLDIELIEQPVKAYDFEGLKFVTDNVESDIMADESAFSPQDVFQLLKLRACDLINIKLMKTGGLYNAFKIASMAEAAGVKCMMGCMLESKVGICAAASLSAGCSIIQKNDLDAADLLACDPVKGGIHYEKNQLILSSKPGLGIEDIEGWKEII